jgi:hypothetical protein
MLAAAHDDVEQTQDPQELLDQRRRRRRWGLFGGG